MFAVGLKPPFHPNRLGTSSGTVLSKTAQCSHHAHCEAIPYAAIKLACMWKPWSTGSSNPQQTRGFATKSQLPSKSKAIDLSGPERTQLSICHSFLKHNRGITHRQRGQETDNDVASGASSRATGNRSRRRRPPTSSADDCLLRHYSVTPDGGRWPSRNETARWQNPRHASVGRCTAVESTTSPTTRRSHELAVTPTRWCSRRRRVHDGT